MALLPPILGGAPSQPLEVGRASRVSTPAQPSALAVRDRGWSSPTATDPWPGARATTWSPGWRVAPPT